MKAINKLTGEAIELTDWSSVIIEDKDGNPITLRYGDIEIVKDIDWEARLWQEFEYNIHHLGLPTNLCFEEAKSTINSYKKYLYEGVDLKRG